MEAAGLVGHGRGVARGGGPMIVLTASGRRLVSQIQRSGGPSWTTCSSH